MLTPGTILENRYRIDILVEEGRFGEVYLATHISLERPVIVKSVNSTWRSPEEWASFRSQFRSEAKVLAALEHRNLAQVLDFFEHDQAAFIVTELIEGKNLADLVAEAESLPQIGVAVGWGLQILDAIEYLHAQTPPLVVRDLKPAHVMLSSGGIVRLTDFGTAHKVPVGQSTQSIVRNVGSRGFAPPEQYGSGNIDERSDIYSFGATLYYFLTGEEPIDATMRIAAPERDPISRPVSAFPSIQPPLWHFLQTCMQPYADQRPASVAEARTLLTRSIQTR